MHIVQALINEAFAKGHLLIAESELEAVLYANVMGVRVRIVTLAKPGAT